MPAPNDKQRETAKIGIRARVNAEQERARIFEQEHPGRFEQLLQKHRVALGLPARSQGPSAEELAAKLRKAEERAEKLREQLKAYETGSTPPDLAGSSRDEQGVSKG